MGKPGLVASWVFRMHYTVLMGFCLSWGTVRSHEIYYLYQPYSKTKAPEGDGGIPDIVYNLPLG